MNTPLRPRREGGVVLLAALLSMVVVTGLAAMMFTTAQAEMQGATTHRRASEVLHLAEAATFAAEQGLLTAAANTLPPPTGGTLAIGGVSVPYTVTPVGDETVETSAEGVQTIHNRYVIEANATLRGYTKRVHRVVDVGLTPIFQFAIFYEGDLELLPGPSMKLTGRVHSNHDMYVGCLVGQTLTIDSNYFRCAGEISRTQKHDGGFSKGNVLVRQQYTSNLHKLFSRSQLARKGVDSESGYDSQFMGFDANGDGDLDDAADWQDFAVGALTTWDGTVQTGAHGMRRVEPPEIGSIKRFEAVAMGEGDFEWDAALLDWVYVGDGNGDYRKGRYHDNADLVILDGQAYDGNGTLLSLPSGTVSEKVMYDAREGKDVFVTEIDVQMLNASGYFPSNGLVYAARRDTTAAQPNGIRLTMGAALSAPLTVASECPVYVHGDYNTVNKKAAAVIADSTNLLSNSWDDSKSPGNLPSASDTTYNFAMITGADETANGVYCGGFENLPRFHENWTRKTCSISGSFVKIYAAENTTGQWSYGGDVYKSPKRNWDYDPMFNDACSLPPFTPSVAQVKSSGYWQ